ncbi:hypothetical protein [Streptomyces sp. NPDC006645]|uniref:hypothetical protein n=1 Tax=unclassified Streptomyces TaxID=2593676 RepID=UPI00339EB2D4
MAEEIGKSPSGVHNVFRLARVPEQRLTMAIVDRLTLRVRDWGVDISQETGIEKALRKLVRLWFQAKQEEEELAAQRKPPHTSDATRRLLFALSPECSMSHPTRQLPQPHDIVALEDPAAGKTPAFLRKTGLRPAAHNPWHLTHLCHGCQARRDTGELTEAELRAARFALDRHPGAARHYAAYHDQVLLGAEEVIDMNVLARVQMIIKADPEVATPPYTLNHGELLVDRSHGLLDWGDHPCEDEH